MYVCMNVFSSRPLRILNCRLINFEKIFYLRFLLEKRHTRTNQKTTTVYPIIYIHNWSLQSFSQDYDLASHTTYVVCINFIHKWRDLQFKFDFERQIFEKILHGDFIDFHSFRQKSAERKSLKKYLHIFVLMSDLGFELGSYV